MNAKALSALVKAPLEAARGDLATGLLGLGPGALVLAAATSSSLPVTAGLIHTSRGIA